MSIDLSLLASIIKTIGDIKYILDTVEKTNIFQRQPKLDELKREVTSLEKQVNSGFPTLVQLLRSYSLILSDVKVVIAISNKASELIATAPDKALQYTGIFINQIETNHGQINFGMSQLPALDVREGGELSGKLNSIRDFIRDIKRENNIQNIKRTFDNISTQYTDVQSILSRLVERILSSLESKN
ncbi:hypothetical protein LC653_06875 [Nostoc sp. CHAB 5784]|uniref:hypothetical protein n=1 Tax=Nostoc mirabile TaxID=2907820 RepID=UPI001E49AA64|nr:hypothetical protein [Nostoc mirabile]MCC5663657.1 hypothetical protein [Nostoc mirabile CHAB5784]